MDNSLPHFRSDLPHDTAPLPSRPVRAGQRVEKGTVKVDEHQTKEEAATLLYSCMTLLNQNNIHIIDDKTLVDKKRNNYLTQIQSEIFEVVTKFGLDNDRLKTMGERHAKDLIVEADRYDIICEAQAKVMEAKAITDRMMIPSKVGVVGGDDELVHDIDDHIIGGVGDARRESSTGSGRSTRHGVANKRAREEDELHQVAKALAEYAKRLRQDRVSSDGSNRRLSRHESLA